MHLEKKKYFYFCVWVCVHMWARAGAHALECGGYRKLLGGFLSHFDLSWRFGPKLTSH